VPTIVNRGLPAIDQVVRSQSDSISLGLIAVDHHPRWSSNWCPPTKIRSIARRSGLVKEVFKMRTFYFVLAVLSASVVLSGCTSNSLIRKDLSACNAASADESKHSCEGLPRNDAKECEARYFERIAQACGRHSIEEHREYTLGFVEFDDLGVPYEPKQMTQLLKRVREEAANPLTVVVFVHGWRHNASADDWNVEGMRDLLGQLAESEDKAAHSSQPKRKVFGIYVGWRGLSLQGPDLLEYASFWDRKAVATHVAQGSVRELFAELRLLRKSKNANSADLTQPPPMRMIIIGHSFGGLVVYHAVSQFLLESVVEYDAQAHDPQVRGFGDLVVLVNPAFEASRYEPLHAITARRTYQTKQRPVFIAVTAENDFATGKAFPTGRFLNTVFESERTDRGREANKKTVGHIDRYRTHVLRHCRNIPIEQQSALQRKCGCAEAMEESAAAHPDLVNEREALNEFESEWSGTRESGLKHNWVRHFCGGAVLSHVTHNNQEHLEDREKYDPNNPFWIVSADSDIIDGHNGISKRAFTDFLRQVFYETVESSEER
jgi:pimeloyl-ACP methyl ester carboxylesterase